MLKQRQRISSKLTKKIFKFDKHFANIGKNKKYYVRTYGCQGNIVDGQYISGILEKMGYTCGKNEHDCDILILNTCAVRENAEKKVFGEIGLLKNLTKKKGFLFGICGCMAQEESVVKKIMEKIKYVNFVFGTHNIYELPYIIEEAMLTNQQVIKVHTAKDSLMEEMPITRVDKVKAFVNITYGCNKFCTYCIVPYTRGQLHSRDKTDVLNEIKDLIKQGYKEVTLLGANVNDYGIDKNDGYYFANLLEDVAKTNIPRIRFCTSNPWNFTKDIVDLFKKYKNLMPYFHLPIQSGSESILKKMNREMKISKYLDLIRYIREVCPSCAISTDLIVGFPNESKSEFKQTLKLYQQVKYDNAYTFIYSKRENTPAASYPDKIKKEEKDKRLQELNLLVQKYAKENNEKYVGRILPVLVEGVSKKNEQTNFGYSPEWKVVNFTGKCKVGDIINIKITSASRFSLNGEVNK